MVQYLGDFIAESYVYFPFNTLTSDDPSASCTITDLLYTDINIYKNASLTQRTSSAGVAVVIDHDSHTGGHLISIDLSDNTDAGFYASGNDYFVKIIETTIDAATVTAFVAHFSIQNRYQLANPSIPTTAEIATAVLDKLLADHTTTGSVGLAISNINTIVKTIFVPLVGHGLHILRKDPEIFMVALNECYERIEELPEEQQVFAKRLMPFWERFLDW